MIGGAIGASPAGGERLLAALGVMSSSRWRGDGCLLGRAASAEMLKPREDSVALVFDGILHNRAEILGLLGGPPTAGAAGLVARAYGKWGISCLDRLDGDFAFALWDGRARRLMLATDAMGMRPLFYWRESEALLFASRVRALHAEPMVPRAIDPEALALWMGPAEGDDPGTPFTGIETLPAGHVLTVEAGRARLERWWRPELAPTLRLGSDAAYAEALRDGLDRAVAMRLPTVGDVAVAMSGGLDSTAVAALAARRLAAEGRRLTALTLVPAGPVLARFGQNPDEGELAALMADAHSNIDHVRVAHGNGGDLLDQGDLYARHCDFPSRMPVALANFDRLWTTAGARNCATILYGAMGNFSISYDGQPHLFRSLATGDVGGWLRLVPGLRRHGLSWRAILNHSLGPALPPAWRRALVAWGGDRRVFRPNPPSQILPWRRELAAGLIDRTLDRMAYRGGDTRRLRLAKMRPGRGLWAAHITGRYGIIPVDPTADRRLMELCLSIPDEQFILGGEPRSLIRRAMRGLVPDAILDSQVRGRQGADRLAQVGVARPALLEELARLESSPLVNDVLDVPRMRRLVENWSDADSDPFVADSAYGFGLAGGMAMGRFLRRFEGGNF